MVNIYNREDGKTVLRYLAERPVISGSEPADARMEDLYLWMFRSRERRKYDETVCIRIKTSAEDEKCRYFDHCGTDTFGSAVLSAVTYIQAYKTDKSGTIQVVTGIEAIKAKKQTKKHCMAR